MVVLNAGLIFVHAEALREELIEVTKPEGGRSSSSRTGSTRRRRQPLPQAPTDPLLRPHLPLQGPRRAARRDGAGLASGPGGDPDDRRGGGDRAAPGARRRARHDPQRARAQLEGRGAVRGGALRRPALPAGEPERCRLAASSPSPGRSSSPMSAACRSSSPTARGWSCRPRTRRGSPRRCSSCWATTSSPSASAQAGAETAQREGSWDVVAERTLAAYREHLGP